MMSNHSNHTPAVFIDTDAVDAFPWQLVNHAIPKPRKCNFTVLTFIGNK